MDKPAETTREDSDQVEQIVLDSSDSFAYEADSMVDWWADTVFLTMFPTLVSICISFLRYQTVDIDRMIGDGEMIMLSCLIIIPSLMRYYRDRPARKTVSHRRYFYILLFVSFLQIVAYASFKTNPKNDPVFVYIISAVCFPGSVGISYRAEKLLRRQME